MRKIRGFNLAIVGVLLLAVGSLVGCIPSQAELDALGKPRGNHNILAPIAYGDFSTFDFFLDSNNKKELTIESDSSLKIVKNTTVFDIAFDSVLSLSRVDNSLKPNNDTLFLTDIAFTNSISFGKLIENSTEAAIVHNSHGDPGVIPPVSSSTSEKVDFQIQKLRNVTLAGGVISISVTNNSIVTQTGIIYHFYDKVTGDELFAIPVPDVTAGGTITANGDLTGKIIRDQMQLAITNSSSGSGGIVTVDTSLIIKSDILFTQLKIENGTFDLISQTFQSDFDMGSSNIPSGVKFVNQQFDSGSFVIELTNNYSFPIVVTVDLPYIGSGFTSTINVPADSVISSFNDLAGLTFDLKGRNGDTVNSIYGTIVFFVGDSIGAINYDRLTDSMIFNMKFIDAKINRAQGSFGSLTVNGNEQQPLFGDEFYSRIQEGNISIEGASIKLEIKSTLGFESEFSFETKTINGRNGNEVVLNPAPTVNTTKALESPLRTDPIDPLVFDKDNSNVIDLVNNFPEFFETNYTAILNPNLDPSDLSQFLYGSSRIKGDLEIEIPLKLNFDGYKIIQNFKFDLGANRDNIFSNQTVNKNLQFKAGELKLLVDNGFPADIGLTLVSKDSTGVVLDTLFANASAIPGNINSNGIVESPSRTIIVSELSAEEYNNLKLTKTVDVIGVIDNKTLEGFYKILADYKVSFKIISDIQYKSNF
jgi:hypothetical protein